MRSVDLWEQHAVASARRIIRLLDSTPCILYNIPHRVHQRNDARLIMPVKPLVSVGWDTFSPTPVILALHG